METRHQFITLAVALTLISCNQKQDKEQQSLFEISKQELATALEERDQLLALVKEVSSGIEQIKQLENIMTLTAVSPTENAGQRAQILTDIASLKEKIQQRKARLQELESKLQKSTINNRELHETVEALSVQMDSQIEEIESLRQQLMSANERIGVLNNAVDSLNTTVSAVTGERNAAREASVRLENELNTCYYVVETNSELKKHNIIESGFLRKTKLMKGDFDRGCFVISDKRMLDILPLKTKKAKILTNHPETSYQITEVKGQKVIRITDPDQFWSLTNYLVVQKD